MYISKNAFKPEITFIAIVRADIWQVLYLSNTAEYKTV